MSRGALSLLTLALIGLTACHCRWRRDRDRSESVSEAGTGSDRWLMKTYDVSPEDAIALLNQLRDLFIVSKGEGTSVQLARASLAPDGRLVVVGDGEVQEGIKDLVAGMANHHATPRVITVTYWLVTGRPAKGDLALPSDLAAVADALHEVSREGGPQQFALWEHLQLVSNGVQGFLQGRHSTIHQDAVSAGDKVLLTTKISASHLSDHMLGPNNIDTKLEIAPDQTVVLAQTGFNPSEPINSQSGNDPPMSLYYLVRASVRNADPPPR